MPRKDTFVYILFILKPIQSYTRGGFPCVWRFYLSWWTKGLMVSCHVCIMDSRLFPSLLSYYLIPFNVFLYIVLTSLLRVLYFVCNSFKILSGHPFLQSLCSMCRRSIFLETSLPNLNLPKLIWYQVAWELVFPSVKF